MTADVLPLLAGILTPGQPGQPGHPDALRAQVRDALRDAQLTLATTRRPALDHLTDAVLPVLNAHLDRGPQPAAPAPMVEQLFTATDVERILADARREWLDELFRERDRPSTPPLPRRPPPEWVTVARALTPRQREIVTRTIRNPRAASLRELAEQMGVTASTARSHMWAAYSKLGVSSQREAVVLLVRHRLIDVHTGRWHPAVTAGQPGPHFRKHRTGTTP